MPIDLETAANDLGVVAPDLKTNSGKVLEAQVLFALALALADHFDVRPRSHTGAPSSGTFKLRGAPGRFADPAASSGPSYFTVAKRGLLYYELHNSLEFKGVAGEHEVDVSAVDARPARIARQANPRMMRGPPTVGVELKEYGNDVDKNLVRAFLACIVDFMPMWVIQAFAIGPDRSNLQHYQFPRRPIDQFWFLTTGALSQPTKDFAHAYAIRAVDHLDVDRLAAAATEMAARLQHLSLLSGGGTWPLPEI